MTKIDHPLAEEQETLAGGSSDQPRVIRVLAVDDQSAATKLLSLILGPPGFHCSTASGGKEALAILAGEKFDAVISDLDMPGMGGMELLLEVRRQYPRMAFLV